MNYKQYDKDGNEINHQDLQAKKQWCKDGEAIEEVFVKKFGRQLSLKINPDKVSNPYAPDLILSGGGLADLKTQNTPFFKASTKYSIDSTFAVVFNRKDAIRYYRKYRDIVIYFWIEWHSIKFVMENYTKEVKYINGVWRIEFKNLIPLLKKAPLHEYIQRKNDTKGNAKSSFVLDIRSPEFERLI
ncbi:hypothetical protein [Aquimarina sp. 2304DJ70-9]|uniref:hypothetical protein n=1 Tax=Aquimarina penaris TaxID=3231044 RepID=UPI003462D6F8